MTEQELQELFEKLEKADLQPMLCDTPVPYYENGVWAGIPTAPGDIVQDDYIMLPQKLMGSNPVFRITVRGNSMRDAGFSPGDRLQVEATQVVGDGDIVVASVDGDYTVKAFCIDEYKQRWLVPCNDEYEPIPLTDDMNVSIVGKVVEHIRESPRIPYGNCLKTIANARTRMRNNKKEDVSRLRLLEVATMMASDVKSGRQWYAVYKGMADRHAVAKGDFVFFVKLVLDAVPEHKHLPVASELQRMSVQSFAKPVDFWDRDDAPVSGGVFDTYLRIAKKTKLLLR